MVMQEKGVHGPHNRKHKHMKKSLAHRVFIRWELCSRNGRLRVFPDACFLSCEVLESGSIGCSTCSTDLEGLQPFQITHACSHMILDWYQRFFGRVASSRSICSGKWTPRIFRLEKGQGLEETGPPCSLDPLRTCVLCNINQIRKQVKLDHGWHQTNKFHDR